MRAKYAAMSQVHCVPDVWLDVERQPTSATTPLMGSSVALPPRTSSIIWNVVGASNKRLTLP